MTDNPFFEPSATPFGLPPFDRIEARHFPPAFDRGMEAQNAAILGITENPEPPSFANTIEALEGSGRLLDQVSAIFFNLRSSHTNDAIEEIARDYAPRLALHRLKIMQNPALFARLATLYERREVLSLASDRRRLLERRYRNFVRAGALLEAEGRARLLAIEERLASLHTAFGQNVLHDEEGFGLDLDEGDLEGLPGFARDAAARAAQERGMEGRFLIPLSRSAVDAFLSFSPRRDLRRKLYEAFASRGAHPGEFDNRPLIAEIVALRREKARLLGYESFADYQLDEAMAKTPAAAERLLVEVWEPAKRKALEERALLERLARADGQNDPLEAWDWHYYAEKVRRERFDRDERELKPYFVLDTIVRAAFAVAGRLFGLSFVERRDWPRYHPDVRVYEVRAAGGRTIGLFLHDNFARPGKRSGAWMGSYRAEESFEGEVLPIVVNNNNFAKGEPTLLSFEDARTLFHEFGHGLHGLLSRARYPSQSGTAVRRDFVEFPSQIFEHWIGETEILRQYARHHETGEAMPEDLIRRLQAARHFGQGFLTVEYTAAALFDLALHREGAASLDIDRFEKELREKIGAPAEIALRHRPAHFQHLFAGAGYAAGYYAYLWAEVLDADGFAAFKERGDIFEPTLAASLRAILEAGDTAEPMELYRAFRGREPELRPLLEDRGLVDRAKAA